jgi:flagellar motility protein MotE (MotC chaperone)
MSADRYAEAIKHQEAFDYFSAINTLETVPVAMRNADHSSLLNRLRSDLDESEQLIEQIKSRLTNRALEGLLDLVNRAVELRGDRKDLHNLQAKLQERSAKQLGSAQSAKARPYAAAIERLGAENFVECPLCLAPTKAKNILAHFDKVHSDEWPLVAQVEHLKIVVDPMSMPTVDTGPTPAGYTGPTPAGDTGTTQAKSDDWEPNGFVVLIGLVLLPWLYYGVGMWSALGAIVILGVVDGLIGLGPKKKFSDQFGPLLLIMFAYGGFVIIVVWLVCWIWGWFF